MLVPCFVVMYLLFMNESLVFFMVEKVETFSKCCFMVKQLETNMEHLCKYYVSLYALYDAKFCSDVLYFFFLLFFK